MSKHILDGVNLEGMTFPTKQQESDLWMEKVPSFCPKCEEIRGDLNGGNSLISSPQTLSWKSFGMCLECYVFDRDHHEEAEANRKAYAERKAQKEQEAVKAVKARRFRVYAVDENEKMSNSSYINSLSKVQFSKYAVEREECTDMDKCPTFYDWCNCKGLRVIKSKDLVTQEVAEQTVSLIFSKKIYAFFEEETIPGLLETSL